MIQFELLYTAVNPTLYSFRRCPYAMRARLALATCLDQHSLELREVVLKDKPQPMLDISPKGTVPVLLLASGEVIEESLDIMKWSFDQNPSKKQEFLESYDQTVIASLIEENDGEFKWALDRYKYADRYEETEEHYREKGEVFLAKLNTMLEEQAFLLGSQPSFLDLAIFPFVRQFAHVNRNWFFSSSYGNLIKWLEHWLESELFNGIMKKYKKWEEGQLTTYFPE